MWNTFSSNEKKCGGKFERIPQCETRFRAAIVGQACGDEQCHAGGTDEDSEPLATLRAFTLGPVQQAGDSSPCGAGKCIWQTTRHPASIRSVAFDPEPPFGFGPR